jgi:tetratricopeptide (TPR) repeat protein
MPVILLSQTEKQYARRADSLLDAGRYAEAIPLYDEAIKRNGSNQMYFRGRGYAYMGIGKLEEGARDYQSALSINPECAICYFNLARIEAARGNLPLALKLVSNALDLDRKMAPAYYLRAEIRRGAGDRINSLIDYNYAIQYDPKEPEYRSGKGLYYLNSGDRNTALENMNAAVELKPDYPKSYFQRARCYVEMERWEDALKDVDRCLELGMKTADVYVTRGAIYDMLGRKEEALADFNQTLALDSNNLTAYYNLATDRYKAEDMDGACEAEQKALELAMKFNPNDPTIPRLQQGLKDHCDPTQLSYYYQRGIAAYNRGEFRKAIGHYEEGLRKFPSSPVLIMFRGNAHLRAKEYGQAIQDYNAVIPNIDRCVEELGMNYRAGRQELGPVRATTLASLYASLQEAKAESGDLEGASQAIDRAIEAAQGLPGQMLGRLHFSRGIVMLATGKNQQAASEFERAAEDLPSDPEIAFNHALALYNLSQQEPIRFTASYISLETAQGGRSTMTLPATISRGENDANLAKASEALDRTIRLDPKDGRAYLLKGYIELHTGDARACADLKKAKELGMSDADALLTAGNCR